MSNRLNEVAKTLAAGLFALTLAGSVIARDADDDEDREREASNNTYAIGLWGDLPYSTVQATVGVPNLIADMNAQRWRSRVHDGDLKRAPAARATTRCTPGAGLLQLAGGAGHVHARATTTGPTATARPTADSLRASGSTRRARCSSRRPTRWVSANCARKCSPTPLCLGVQRSGTLRRESPLDVGGVTYVDTQHPGLLQQPVRHGAGPGRVCGPQCRQHRVDAGDVRRSHSKQFRRRHAHLAGQSRLRLSDPHPRYHCAIRKTLAETDGAARRLQGLLARAARRGHRLPQACGLRARRLALLPHRQAVPDARPAPGELHPRRNVRQQRRATATTTCSG